jgi:hypothetical protein
VAGKEDMLYVRYMFLLLCCIVCKIDKLLKLEYKISTFQVIRYSVLEKLNVFVRQFRKRKQTCLTVFGELFYGHDVAHDHIGYLWPTIDGIKRPY